MQHYPGRCQKTLKICCVHVGRNIKGQLRDDFLNAALGNAQKVRRGMTLSSSKRNNKWSQHDSTRGWAPLGAQDWPKWPSSLSTVASTGVSAGHLIDPYEILLVSPKVLSWKISADPSSLQMLKSYFLRPIAIPLFQYQWTVTNCDSEGIFGSWIN